MRTIFKYPLTLQEVQMIEMPREAKLIDVQLQNGVICVWAEVDPENRLEDRMFRIYGTGHPLDANHDEFLFTGTVQIGQFVWHVYDKINN